MSDKIATVLSPQQEKALLSFIKSQLLEIEKNEILLKETSPSPEVLHDFRVAFRRFRAILGGMKNFLPDDNTLLLKKSLKNIASHTTKLRDLDVFLAQKNVYLALAAPEKASSLAQFFSELSDQHTQITTELKNYIETPEYLSIKSNWLLLFKESPSPPFLSSKSLSVLKEIFNRIYKLFKKSLRLAKKSKNTSDNQIHQLRILLKKTRYLTEFFTQIFPLPSFFDLINNIKPIQTQLGEFHDLCVQEKKLSCWLKKQRNRKEFENLLKSLQDLKKQTKLKTTASLKDFRKKNLRIFKNLKQVSGEETFSLFFPNPEP